MTSWVAPRHVDCNRPLQTIDLADTRGEDDDASRLGQLKHQFSLVRTRSRAEEVKMHAETLLNGDWLSHEFFGQHPFEQFSMSAVDDQLRH